MPRPESSTPPVPAGRSGAHTAFLAGLAITLTITVADVAVGERPVLIGLLAVPPILTVPLGDRRSTSFIALLCFAISMGSLAWDPPASTLTGIVRVAIVSLAGVASIWAVGVRERADRAVAELAEENARLLEAERFARRRLEAVARTLQRSLLPPALPALPGYELAAAFRPAGVGNEVGGDFYDAFALGPGRWALVIGDVCGKGPDAAALTALARYGIRTITAHETGPSAVLTELNDILLRHGDHGRFCTAIFASLDTAEDGRVRYASGGHLPPIVIRGGRAVEQPRVPGTLLGVVEDPRLPALELALDAGDTLVLITDGVVEARRSGGQEIGTAGVLRALSDEAPATPQRLADRLADLAQSVPGEQRDDIAVLVLRRT